MTSDTLIRVSELVKDFPNTDRTRRLSGIGVTRAIDKLTLAIRRGESLGIIGESGSGKTTLGRCIVGLERPTSGSINFEDLDLRIDRSRPSPTWFRHVQIVFQDSFGAMNPRYTVRAVLDEPLRLLDSLSPEDRAARIEDMMREVRLEPRLLAVTRHELSGGQAQRVNIARALIVQPRCIVLDEPVSSLDASIRGGILRLLRQVSNRYGVTYLYISHDLDTVELVCDRVAIMNRGSVVEVGPTSTIFNSARHPYTKRLLASRLTPDPNDRSRMKIERTDRLSADAYEWLSDDRWSVPTDRGRRPPNLIPVGVDHLVASCDAAISSETHL